MAYFASPFYQGLISLEHSCRPKPTESTYTSSYRDMAERVQFMKLEADRAKEAALAKLEQRKKAALFRIACPQNRTIYQTEFTRPDDKLAFLNIGKNDEKRGEEKEESKKIDDEKQLRNSSDKVGDHVLQNDGDIKGKTVSRQVPEWKKIGWRDKKACWLRPLEERREYKPDMSIYPFTRPCKRCK